MWILRLSPLLLLLAGCAALPWPERDVPAARESVGGFCDLRGVVHVHTRGSHDSPGTVDELLAGAREAGLAWIAVTEHRKPGKPPAAALSSDPILIPGFELGLAGGSLLALGIDQPPERFAPVRDTVEAVHAQGGVAIVAHLEEARVAEYDGISPDGVEVVNLHASAESERWHLVWRILLLPRPFALRSLLRGWASGNTERWYQLPSASAAVGGVDAHAKFRLLGSIGGTVDRYGSMFRLVTTHVLARERSRDAVIEALRAGRSYVAFEGVERVDRFRFERRMNGFIVETPAVARLVLVCDGVDGAESHGTRAYLVPPEGAQECHTEAFRGNRRWIVSSRLRAVGPPAPRQARSSHPATHCE